MASIIIQDVSISFPLFHSESRSFKKTVFAAASARLGRDTKKRVVVQALKDITFTLNSGDRLGFIGSNGAGKTTLLRTLAGIYEPYHGQIAIYGAVTALLDANQGMNLELTGRENIRLRGLFTGLNETQLKTLEADVASFSELEQFLELPVRTYSSGMVVRLGFALATAIKPQILLMDEWILAGDAGFMERARHRLETMVRGAEILVLSSHSAEIIMKWCNRVIWMDNGRIKADGPPEDVLAAYLPPEQLQEAKAVALIKA
jgi:lipopolysaccharide transport system ATP-binding protein